MKKVFFLGLAVIALGLFSKNSYSQIIDINSPKMIEAIIWEETHFQYWKTSNMGCVGLMQIGKATLYDYNKRHNTQWSMEDIRLNPDKNKKVGVWYWSVEIPRIFSNMNRNLKRKGAKWRIKDTIKNRLIAYNACPNRVKKYNNPNHKEYKYLPKETRNYLKKITERLNLEIL